MSLSIYKTIGTTRSLNGIKYGEPTGSRISIDKFTQSENGTRLESVKDFITFANLFNGKGEDQGMELKVGVNLNIFSNTEFDYGIIDTVTHNTLHTKEDIEIFEAGIHLLDQPSKKDKRTWGRFKFKQHPTQPTHVWELDRLLNLGLNETSYFLEILVNTYLLDKIFYKLNQQSLNPYIDVNLGKRTPLRNFLRNDDVSVPPYHYTKLNFYKTSKNALEYAKQINKLPGHFLLSPESFAGKVTNGKFTIFSTIETDPIIENYEFYLSWHESNQTTFILTDVANTVLELRFRSQNGLSKQVFYVKYKN